MLKTHAENEETITTLFSKNSKLKFSTVVSIVCQVKGYRNILKLSCRSLAFTSYIAFSLNKKWYGTSLLAS